MQRWSDFVRKRTMAAAGDDDTIDLRDEAEEEEEDEFGPGRHLDVLIPKYLVVEDDDDPRKAWEKQHRFD